MPPIPDLIDALPRRGPASLWEAVGLLSHLREQEAHALREGDYSRGRRLAQLQALAWSYIRAFAEPLEARGDAPPGMVERLRLSLKIPLSEDLSLLAALRRLACRPPVTAEGDSDRLAA